MNQAGDHLFANPGFPQNQDFGVGPSGRLYFAPQRDHLRTFTKKHRRVHDRTPDMLKHALRPSLQQFDAVGGWVPAA
jgi:hypothetical protein